MSKHIRNFAIIAHIDHGKSTLADRLLEHTGALTHREQRAQFLDNMDIERERGITIKAQTVQLHYRAMDGKDYQLNLIDTPGHVDFNYEVSRSLAACEGALLIVDATQGVEAQTLANVYLALDAGLEIVPVINKIDLPSADVERVRKEIEDVIGIDASQAIPASAKTGLGIDEVLEAIVTYVPPPKGDANAPFRALIIDSWFDTYRGVIALVRVMDGRIQREDRVRLMATNLTAEVTEIGVYAPFPRAAESLEHGQVGFIVTMTKELPDVKIGDTITLAEGGATEALVGFKEVQPMVFAGVYPIDTKQYDMLRTALSKLKLNDSALTFEPETSAALGFGFRCGFLGLLHMEIVQERLEREYNLELISTAPTVIYHINLDARARAATETGPLAITIDTPAKMPRVDLIESIEEPFILATIHVPSEYVGPVLNLCQERRGIQIDLLYSTGNRVLIKYELPLAEVLFDFFDKLKSCSRGYASLDYEMIGYRAGDLIKLDILVNNESVDALSIIVHRDFAYDRGKMLIHRLRKLIHRQMFEIPIQAAIGSRIIARETIKAFRKNVTAKCYGGDISRKRKLLEKQKKGKARMKMVGSVEIPQEAFLAVLNTSVSDDDDD
jgi:GTP-binding protein LepA